MFKNRSKEKHLAIIVDYLEDNEEVLFECFATIVTNGDLGTDGGALVVTGSRVLFSGDAPLLGTASNVAIDFIDINGVSSGQKMLKGGLIQPYLEINAGGSAYFFNMKPMDAAEAAQEINLNRTRKQAPLEATSTNKSIAEQLETLALLVEKGLLTREEFDAEKKKLL